MDIALATEDELSESVGKRLLAGHSVSPSLLLRRNGSGYLQKKMESWCKIAKRHPVLLLADLDRRPCPPAMLSQWLGRLSPPKHLLFRIAVREIESWLLADHDGLEKLLGFKPTLPADPDAVQDPKQLLLTLARKARREVRDDLVSPAGAMARQGLGYNFRLCAFVAKAWNVEKASSRSDSLRRTRMRISELVKSLAKA